MSGSVFDYVRNGKFDANSFFANRSFNRANFAVDAGSQTVRTVMPTGTIQNLNFGLSTAILSDQLSGFTGGGSTPGFNQLYSVGAPRSLQFAAKIIF